MPGWLFFLLIIFLISIVVVVSVVSIKISAKKNCVSWVEKLWKKDSTKAISSSLLSILFGMIIGCLILFLMILFPTQDVQINLNQALNGIQLIFFGLIRPVREDLWRSVSVPSLTGRARVSLQLKLRCCPLLFHAVAHVM